MKRPIKESKQTRGRYRDEHVAGNNQAFIEEVLRLISTTTNENSKFLTILQVTRVQRFQITIKSIRIL